MFSIVLECSESMPLHPAGVNWVSEERQRPRFPEVGGPEGVIDIFVAVLRGDCHFF